MKKQIVISDIDFLNPEQDSYSSDNVVRNLLGNYYFTTKDKNICGFLMMHLSQMKKNH